MSLWYNDVYILRNIFQFLKDKEREAVALVCKRWLDQSRWLDPVFAYEKACMAGDFAFARELFDVFDDGQLHTMRVISVACCTNQISHVQRILNAKPEIALHESFMKETVFNAMLYEHYDLARIVLAAANRNDSGTIVYQSFHLGLAKHFFKALPKGASDRIDALRFIFWRILDKDDRALFDAVVAMARKLHTSDEIVSDSQCL